MREPLKSVFEIKKKPYDVYLSEEEVIWTPVKDEAESKKKSYKLITKTLPMGDIIGALIRKRKNPKKSHKPGKLLGLTLFTFTRGKDRTLAESRLSLESKDEELCQLWMTTINDILKERPGRPQKLKVFINPNSKKGKAPSVYETFVAPLFKKAGIKTEVIKTEKAGHAWEALARSNLDSYDGVVCVGGDGIVHEVVNGLLEKAHSNAGFDVLNDALPEDYQAVKLDMRIGIIPAGSTDVVISSAQGSNDPVTSAIHIILGHCQPLDICSLENANRLIRFSFSSAYGFLGDVLKSSEQSRWMGPSRYKWAAVKRMCGLKTYEVEINYLLSNDKEYHPRDNQRCRTGCEVCDRPDSSAEEETKEWKTFKGQVVGVSLITLPSPCEISPDGPSPCCHLGDGYTDMIIVRGCSKTQMYSHVQRNFNSKDQIRTTSKNNRVYYGPYPEDIRRAEAAYGYFRHDGDCVLLPTRFDFEFVEVHRVKQCHIRAVTEYEQRHKDEGENQRLTSFPRSISRDRSIGVWNVDGELLNEPSVLFRVHRKLVTVFGQGIADVAPEQGCLNFKSR